VPKSGSGKGQRTETFRKSKVAAVRLSAKERATLKKERETGLLPSTPPKNKVNAPPWSEVKT